MKKPRLGRRSFLKTGAAAGVSAAAGLSLGPRLAHAASSPVYVAHDPAMTSGLAYDKVDLNLVQAAVDACVKALTGKASVGEAYKSIFAGIDPTKKIAVKLNNIKPLDHPVNFALVRALVNGLLSMSFSGTAYPAANISFFDNDWGGVSNKCKNALGYQQHVAPLGVVLDDPGTWFGGPTFSVKGATKQACTYLDAADYGVSIAPLRYHKDRCDLTGCIKNMMGAVSSTTGSFTGGPDFHDNPGWQSFKELWSNYIAKNNKLQLYIVEALFAHRWDSANHLAAVNRVIVGTDPCAVDACGAVVLQTYGGLGGGEKALPLALEQAGFGNSTYTVNSVPVSPTASRDSVDGLIRDRRGGKATDSQVRSEIKSYRESK